MKRRTFEKHVKHILGPLVSLGNLQATFKDATNKTNFNV